MIRNTTSQKVQVFAYDYSTGAPKTGDGANLTVYVKKDSGSLTALTDTSATEVSSSNAPGWYEFDVTQGETDAVDLLFTGKSSTSNVVVVGFRTTTVPANFALASIDSNGRVDVIKVAGTTQTARDLGASVLLSVGTGTGQVNLSSGKVPATLASTDVTGNVAADLQTIKTQTVTCSGGVTVPAATLASTTNITAGTITTTTNLTNAPPDSSGVTTLLSRIPSGLFTGITSLAQWLGLLAGKQTGNSTARTEIRATGAGSGTYDETTDSQEALRDRGDAAWVTVTAATIRSAVGLASANLDTQLSGLPAAVWDLSTTGHTTSGTFGAAMNAAGSAGDPWSTSLPGAYGAGTAGAILGGIPTTLGSPLDVDLATDISNMRNVVDGVNADVDGLVATVGVAGAGLTDLGDTRLANLDAAVGTRLATSGYTAPLSAAGTRTAVGLASANLDTQLAALPTAAQNADKLLGRNLAGGSDGGRTVQQALYPLRNKVTVVGTTMTVYAIDDTTSSWVSTLTTDATADPITASDPA